MPTPTRITPSCIPRRDVACSSSSRRKSTSPMWRRQATRRRSEEPVLTTPRLVLREMTRDDLDFVAEMMGDPDVTRYYPKQYSREEARHWLERQLERYRRDGHGLWLVTLKSTGEPVGQVGLAMQDVDGIREPEVGWLLHRP